MRMIRSTKRTKKKLEEVDLPYMVINWEEVKPFLNYFAPIVGTEWQPRLLGIDRYERWVLRDKEEYDKLTVAMKKLNIVRHQSLVFWLLNIIRRRWSDFEFDYREEVMTESGKSLPSWTPMAKRDQEAKDSVASLVTFYEAYGAYQDEYRGLQLRLEDNDNLPEEKRDHTIRYDLPRKLHSIKLYLQDATGKVDRKNSATINHEGLMNHILLSIYNGIRITDPADHPVYNVDDFARRLREMYLPSNPQEYKRDFAKSISQCLHAFLLNERIMDTDEKKPSGSVEDKRRSKGDPVYSAIATLFNIAGCDGIEVSPSNIRKYITRQ